MDFLAEGSYNVVHHVILKESAYASIFLNGDKTKADPFDSIARFTNFISRTSKRPLTRSILQSEEFMESIENTLLMSEKQIGPTIYDVTLIKSDDTRMYLQYIMAYHQYTVDGFIYGFSENQEAMDTFVTAYLAQVRKLIDNKLLCIDIKPSNMVMGHYDYQRVKKEQQQKLLLLLPQQQLLPQPNTNDFLLFIDFDSEFCLRNRETYASFKQTMKALGYNSQDMNEHMVNLLLLLMALHFIKKFQYNIFAEELQKRLFVLDHRSRRSQETESAVILRNFCQKFSSLRDTLFHYFPQVFTRRTSSHRYRLWTKHEEHEDHDVLNMNYIFLMVTKERVTFQ